MVCSPGSALGSASSVKVRRAPLSGNGTLRAGPTPCIARSTSAYRVLSWIGKANRAGGGRLDDTMKYLNRPPGDPYLVARRAPALPGAFSETGQLPSAGKFAILVLRT